MELSCADLKNRHGRSVVKGLVPGNRVAARELLARSLTLLQMVPGEDQEPPNIAEPEGRDGWTEIPIT